MTPQQAHPAPTCASIADELLAAVRFGVPELLATHVPRERLLEVLAGADAVPLVLVSGPAGTGKTTLVAEWVRRAHPDESIGWVTFEDGESDFWEYVLTCLVRLGLDLPEEVLRTTTNGLLGIQRLAALTGVLADSPHRFTVVLDGYEMASLELAREVDFLLRHTLGRLCLVFVGRVDPVLPLYRYRLMDSLLEIRVPQLAFTDAEASELLAGLGVTLSRGSVHELNQRIKGWAAGLRFAGRALAGREHPEASVATVVSQTGDINEYLVGEVLDAQAPEVRRFLLDTCVPRILSPALVEELGGAKAVRILDDLARSNAFIEAVPDQPDLYRYYPFFRELLHAQLAYEDPERMVELHRRTARWLDREGLTERAIGHLAAIGAWDDVAEHLVHGLLVGRLLLEGPDGPLLAAAGELPRDAEHRAGRVVSAAIHLRAGDRAAAAHELEAARGTGGPDDEAAELSITVLDAVRAATTDATDSAAAAVQRAERQLDEQPGSRTARAAELSALVQLSKGVVMFRAGDLLRARKALTKAIGLDASRRFASFRAECLGHLALIDALEGYVSRAHRTAGEAVTVAADAGIPPEGRSPAAQVALAFVALERYELRAAREHVASAGLCRSLPGDHLSRALIEAVVAGLERAGGHLQPGLARLEAAASRAAPTDPWLADHLRVQAARLSVASGMPEQALSVLAEAEQRDLAEGCVVAAAAYAEQGQQAAAAEALGRLRKRQAPLGTQVAGILVEVLQESRGRSPGRARVALDRSLRLAAPEELRRPFREAGPSVQRLLAADPGLLLEHPWLNHSTRSGAPKASGKRDLGMAGPTRSEPSAQLVETLTAKELEVLGHLEELLTTEEIAEKMFVSVNTVRTHVRSILRKLGVSRRNAAVRKARELGLFDG